MPRSDIAARNAAQIEAMYTAYAGGDLDAVLGLLAPDVIWHSIAHETLPWAGERRGLDAVQAYFAAVMEAFQVTAYRLDRVLAEDDTVVVLASIRLMNRATGEERGYEKVDVLRLSDGRIVEFREYYDSLGVARLRGGT